MTELMIQSEMSNLSQDNSLFSKLCTLLLNDLEKKRTIRERTLLDFSKQIVQILSQSTKIELPSSFFMLAEYANDYFRYDSDDELDLRRGTSYARVFQMTQLLSIREVEQKKTISLFQDIEQNRKNAKLFEVIFHSPWITHKELCTALDISAPALTQRIAPIEAAGYLTSQRLGKRKHYFLTGTGISLHKKLSPQNATNNFPRNWSAIKTQLLNSLLVSYSDSGYTLTAYPVIECVQVIDRLSDSRAECFLLQLKSRHMHANSFNNALLRIQPTPSSTPSKIQGSVLRSQNEYYVNRTKGEKSLLQNLYKEDL